MHGLGNDFVIVEENQIKNLADLNILSRKICDRHFGVGADGLVIIETSERADARMRIFNPDGSEAEMCGNAIRCFAKYLFERGIVSKKRMVIETLAGLIVPELELRGGEVASVKVDMGEPRFKPSEIPVDIKGERIIGYPLVVEEKEFLITCVSMGNPHCVIFTDDVENIPIEVWGPKISEHPLFPRKTNVEFVQVNDPCHVVMRVWERGAGETLACGTGACASAVAAIINGKCHRKIKVSLLGGDLLVEWNDKDNHVYMTGPAEEVFTGKIKRL